MRIQHNIAALNSYRNLTNNNSAVAKNLEKLSSGYRINRAGDDAAGLAISEKMRAQITGLATAQKNANDGISLIQTAEGAMTEVHSMLNRMYELANQSANGTYNDEVDRVQLQKEVNSLREEIDRIAQSSNFNGTKLLDGSLDKDNASKVIDGDPIDVPILPDAATDPTADVGKKTVLKGAKVEAGKTEITAALHNAAFNLSDGDTITLTVGDNTVTLTADATAGDNPAPGTVKTGALSGEELAKAFVAKFNETDETTNLIGGQAFTAEVSGANKDQITFKQNAVPTNANEVVNAGVAVTLQSTANPIKSYSVQLEDADVDAINAVKKLTVAGQELTLTTDLTELDGTQTVTDADGKEMTVKYDAAAKTLTMSGEGVVTAPAVAYGTAGDTVNASTTNAKATYTGTMQAGDTVTIDGTTIEYNALDTNGDKAAVNTAGGNYQWSWDDTAKTFTVTANTNGAGYNGEIAKGTIGGQANTSVTLAGGAGTNTSVEEDVATYTSGTMQTGDTVTIDGTTIDFDTLSTNGDKAAADTANGKYQWSWDDTAKTFTVTAKDPGAAGNLATTGTIGGTAGTAITITGGKDNIAAAAEFDISTWDEGQLKIGDTTFDWDDTKTLEENVNALDGETAGDFTISVTDAANGKIVIKETTAGGNATAPASVSVNANLVSKNTTAPAEGADPFTGTWNVATTLNKQGGAASAEVLASTVFDLTAGLVKDGQSLTIGENTYVFQIGKDSVVKDDDSRTVINLKDYSAADGDKLIDAAGRALSNQDGKTFTIGYNQNTNKISVHEVAGQTAYTDELKDVKTFDALIYANKASSSSEAGKALKLQIGDTSDPYNQMSVSIGDCHTNAMGKTNDDGTRITIADINIANQEDAAAAVDVIKDAINYVSDVRGGLGALQNRLEHTINNLSVTEENITAAESRIRDVDMAKEMMAYTKNNILVQAAQAMLAQANQVPQGVLQLLQ